MHSPLPVAFVLALAVACQSPPSGMTAADGAEDWVSLDSLDHWRGYRQEGVSAGWELAEGALHRVGGAGDLITREQFASFELELEWKISPLGNSGIMYHVSEDQRATYMSGPEMQVLDNAVFGGEIDWKHAAGADYALYPPPVDSSRPAGEWNQIRMLVDGAHVEYWLNGVRQCAYELWSEEWAERVAQSKFAQWPSFGLNETGHIALQDHGDEVWFRNIRIRRL